MRLKRIISFVLFIAVFSPLVAIPSLGKSKNLKVFIERSYMDFDFLRRNIAFVDFVNDKELSDVQIVFNRRRAGNDGWNYTLTYYSNTIENIHDYTLSCFTMPDMSDEEIRKILLQTLKMGLMPFMNEATGANSYRISKNKWLEKQVKQAEKVDTVKPVDPWNSWVFRFDVSGNYKYEQLKRDKRYVLNFRTSRITNKWKYRIGGGGNERTTVNIRRNSLGEINDTVTITNTTSSAYAKMVYSLSDRWSLGSYVYAYSSTYRNTGFSATFRPGLEYNLFPWDESHKRVLTLGYFVGPMYKNYFEKTESGHKEQFLMESSLEVNFELIQSWGEVNSSISSEQFLNLSNSYDIKFKNDISVRVAKGFSVRFDFIVSKVNNQIYLAAKEVSEEEQFLNAVKLPTDIELYTGLGIRYQFGSMFNNIVNNRMD